ncbi:MAG: prepilin-type N-terminal cleavage/methylation domain-containing protein [Gammaproteobacteria bacterium]|nr:prepilin-type N-terminal cleavage/methylation domain-containing protein [Gammaproteobacteria bacterium]
MRSHATGFASCAGFTLVELAIVLTIIATLLGTLLVPLATRVEANNIRATDRAMAEIREALLGYAVINRRLPCPDTDMDGSENGGGAVVCAADEGFLPWADLGAASVDAWGRLYRYRVTAAFAREGLSLSDTGDIHIVSRGDNASTAGIVEQRGRIALGTGVPVVVLSHGPNGYGGTTLSGTRIADPDTTNDETRDERNNRNDASSEFVFRGISAEGSHCDDAIESRSLCAFDDRVVWLSGNVLFNRMITAGVLP